MSEQSEFAIAAQGAKLAADRQGLIIDWMRWDERAKHLSWTGKPKRQAMAEARICDEFVPSGRGSAQGSLL